MGLKDKYNQFLAERKAEKQRLDAVRAEVREKEAMRREQLKEERIMTKEEAIRQRPEMLRQRREAFRQKIKGTISSAATSIKKEMSKPRPKSKPQNMMGGMNFGNPLAEFDRKPKRNPYANPLAEFDRKPGKRKKMRNNGFGWM